MKRISKRVAAFLGLVLAAASAPTARAETAAQLADFTQCRGYGTSDKGPGSVYINISPRSMSLAADGSVLSGGLSVEVFSLRFYGGYNYRTEGQYDGGSFDSDGTRYDVLGLWGRAAQGQTVNFKRIAEERAGVVTHSASATARVKNETLTFDGLECLRDGWPIP